MHRTILTVTLAVLLAPGAAVRAQNAQEPGLDELELTELLSVRSVTGARRDQRLVDSPRQIAIITADDIRRRNYRSVPQAVADVPGVYVQETNDGGGSPIIRGLIGNQVLILIDGVRLNTGAYRFGPNQYLNTIDLNQVERIEVLRGAGSVLYGSDALGGVVNVITRSADRNAVRPLTTRWFSRLSSADSGAVGRGEAAVTAGALGAIGGLSVKQFGRRRGGGDSGVQRFSGYDEWDGDLKVDYRLALRHTLTFAAQRVSQSDVLRTDTLTAGTDLKMEWESQTRTGGSVRYDATELGRLVEQFSVTLAYQRQAERYARIAAAAPGVELRHFDRTNSVLANVQLTSMLGPRHLLTYGLDATSDRITSRREDLTLATGGRLTGKGGLADGAAYDTWAVFLQDEFDLSPRLHFNLGARYSAFLPDAIVRDASTGAIGIDSHLSALTGSVLGLFRLNPAFDVVGGVSQGFRAPNIDDLTILGASGSHFEVPNPQLAPEAFEWDLFAQENRRVFGLDQWQIVRAGAIGGAAIGGVIDAATLGHSFLLGSVIGGVVGGIASWFGTEQAVEVKVLGQSVAGRIATIGPLRDRQFPWVLLDRALLHFASVVGRAHAKRDPLKVEPREGKLGASSALDMETRDAIGALFARVRDEERPVPPEIVDALAAVLLPLLTAEVDGAG